mmetsp:Transcript_57266/g.166145  ORF Transcript_57266/g.166145 Transcript_57266/m.166145 type:complete len:225 (-) Transcript_57266:565-1239(-)
MLATSEQIVPAACRQALGGARESSTTRPPCSSNGARRREEVPRGRSWRGPGHDPGAHRHTNASRRRRQRESRELPRRGEVGLQLDGRGRQGVHGPSRARRGAPRVAPMGARRRRVLGAGARGERQVRVPPGLLPRPREGARRRDVGARAHAAETVARRRELPHRLTQEHDPGGGREGHFPGQLEGVGGGGGGGQALGRVVAGMVPRGGLRHPGPGVPFGLHGCA